MKLHFHISLYSLTAPRLLVPYIPLRAILPASAPVLPQQLQAQKWSDKIRFLLILFDKNSIGHINNLVYTAIHMNNHTCQQQLPYKASTFYQFYRFWGAHSLK